MGDDDDAAAVDGLVEASVDDEASVVIPMAEVVGVVPALAVVVGPVGVCGYSYVAVGEGGSADAYPVSGGIDAKLGGGSGAAVEEYAASNFGTAVATYDSEPCAGEIGVDVIGQGGAAGEDGVEVGTGSEGVFCDASGGEVRGVEVVVEGVELAGDEGGVVASGGGGTAVAEFSDGSGEIR